jgi:transposase-like protein
MTIKQQPKASMHAVNGLSDPGASQGARRATEDAPGSAAQASRPGADSEVVAHARRRQFSNADKRRILEAADRCTKPGEIGALMRREGVYSSSLSTWRRQREAADLVALAPQKRGPKVDPHRAETLHIVPSPASATASRAVLRRPCWSSTSKKNWPPCWTVRPAAPTRCDASRA